MRTVRVLVFIGLCALLGAFAARIDAPSGAAAPYRCFAAVMAHGGEGAAKLLAAGIIVAALALSMDAARRSVGFGPASVAALVLIPLAGAGGSDARWLFTAFFGALFAWMSRAAVRAGSRGAALTLPLVAGGWAYVDGAAAVFVPILSAGLLGEAGLRWAGGRLPAPKPVDGILFKPEDFDRGALLRVLSWETKLNQMVHARLGMTQAQLLQLTLEQAVAAINPLLEISDLPAQAAVPDLGVADGDMRARNRKILEIHYKDALRDDSGSMEGHEMKAVPIASVMLGALLATAAARLLPLALGAPVFSFSAFSLDSYKVPWGWGSAAATHYYWGAAFFLVAGFAAALAHPRRRAASFSILAGLAVLVAGSAIPAAGLFLSVVLLPLATAPWEGVFGEDALIHTLSWAAAAIVLVVGLHMAHWDYYPLSGPPAARAAAAPR